MEQKFMQVCINLAQKAKKSGDVPVGAVIVKDGKIIAKGYNKKNKLKNCTAHAEMIAISKANKKFKDFRLDGCDMYVTFEPCVMCLGAILSARIDTLYFGAYDRRFGSVDYVSTMPFNHKLNVVGGVMESECSKLLTDFFVEIRNDSDKDIKSN